MTGNGVIGAVVLVATFSGTLLGLLLQRILPQEQLNSEVREVLKLVIGVVGTLSALVLGLIINSSRGSYDQQRQELIEVSAKFVTLDRTLAGFGPETRALRESLRSQVARAIERIWPSDGSTPARLEPEVDSDQWMRDLQTLTPSNDLQRNCLMRASTLATEILNARWMLFEQAGGSVPRALIFVITFWFVLIFVCLGLLACRKATVLAMLLLCALSVSGAMVLSLEFDRPFDGLVRLSSEPLAKALAQMGH
jgi:hypothetical protein